MRRSPSILSARKFAGRTAARITFDLDRFPQHCLINGLDDIGLTMEKAPHIDNFESKAASTRAWA